MTGVSPDFLRHVRGRWAAICLTAFALVPVAFVAWTVAGSARNIVYWDEFDTALDLLLALDTGVDFRGFFERIFAINNEHRMITSRLLFALSWWTTGTVDFEVIGFVGNLFLVALCVTLVVSAGRIERRVRLGVVLGAFMFHLQHYENFLWSGASIDHFQVVALAVGAIVGLSRASRLGFGVAAVLAVLATFTLAQGLVIWPVGAFMLWRDRERRGLWIWLVLAALTALAYFQGFAINSGHQIAHDAGISHVIVYWLALLGAPLAFGHGALAPYAGVLLLIGMVWLGLRRGWHLEPVMLPVALFCVGALGLIAIGRAEVAGGQLQSRYMVLSALAWAALTFALMEYMTHPLRPWRVVIACVPILAAFNVVSNVRFAPAVESFVEGRDEAALRYKQYRQMGNSQFRLYPVPARAEKLLRETARRGLYALPRMCERVDLPGAKPSGRIAYHIDEVYAQTPGTYISGWAVIPDEISHPGDIYLVLRSPTTDLIFNTVPKTRPDVVAAHGQPGWRDSGFRFAVDRSRLPPEELQIGILIKRGEEAEYIMTDHRFRPYSRGEPLLANRQ
ncbi:MAG: hypothetical protein JNL92_15335 [Opitutaceae bacterium]|nr:hypothetical protein [Opitutaceae bacterium]